jgi:hypothetical protein
MKRFLLGILGVTLVFGLMMTGCENGTADPLSSDAALKSITVNGVEATLGTPADTWSATEPGIVGLPQDKLTDAKVAVNPVGAGAKIYYVACKSGALPDFVEASTFTFDYGDSLYIEVFSANHDKVLFYQVEIAEAVALINDVTVGGRSASGGTQLSGIPIPKFGNGVGKPGTALDDPSLEEGEVWYGTSQEGTEVTLEVTPKFASTPYLVATGNGSGEPAFEESSGKVTLTSGNFIYIHTTGEGGTQDAYYKIKLTAKDDNRTLTSVTINGDTMDIGQMGTHSFPGAEAYGNYSDGAELATTGNRSSYTAAALSNLSAITVVATTASDKSTVTYGHATDERSYLVDFGDSGSLGKLKADEYIALEVTSELGEKGWYKFQTLLPSISSVSVGTVTNITPGKYAIRNGTFGVNFTGTATVVLVPPDELASASLTLTVTKATGFENATIEYGTGNGLPSNWNSTPPAITDGLTVIIRVTDTTNIGGAPSYEGYQYFGVVIAKDGPPEITSLQVGAIFNWNTYGYDPVVLITNKGTSSADKDTVTAGSVVLTNSQAEEAMPILGTAGTGIDITFAKTTGAVPDDTEFEETIAPNYTSTFVHTPSYNFADGDVIWVKAVRGSYTNYYKINVSVVDVSGSLLSSMPIQGDFNFMDFSYGYTATANLGKPAETLAGITTPGAVTLETAKVTSNTGGLYTNGTAGTNDTVSVARTTGADPVEEDWQTIVAMAEPPHYVFANNDILWVKVVNATEQTTYYKIVVTVE